LCRARHNSLKMLHSAAQRAQGAAQAAQLNHGTTPRHNYLCRAAAQLFGLRSKFTFLEA
jgi:hypothetical protein